MILRCIECGRESVTGRHWRAYLASDPCEDDPPELVVYCPSCAEREFGSFGEIGNSFGKPMG